MHKSWRVLKSGLAGFAITRLLRGNRRRGERRQLKAPVQTWEDEGGHVTDVHTVNPNRGAA